MYLQTSPGLKPLTRAHAACLVPRKGTVRERGRHYDLDSINPEAVGAMLASILADPEISGRAGGCSL